MDQNVDQLDDPDPAVFGKAGSRPHVEETLSASVGQYHTIIWQDKKSGGIPRWMGAELNERGFWKTVTANRRAWNHGKLAETRGWRIYV